MAALTSSDFTLCPAGGNAETYRMYEAMVMGSVPILQRSLNASNMFPWYPCQHTYAFVQDLNPPVVWLDDWSELPAIMEALRRETDEQIYQRRCARVLHAKLTLAGLRLWSGTTTSRRRCCGSSS